MITTLPAITDATRREFIALLGAAGLLTACGSDGDDGPTTETRPFRHALGTTEIPVAPARLVTMNPIAAFNAAALGLVPVASVETVAGGLDVVGDLVKGVDVVGTESEPNYEAIAAARPDLVILAASDGAVEPEGAYQRVSEIAPAVAIDYPGDPTGWREYVLGVADAIGRRDRAEQLLGERDRRIAELRPAAITRGPVATLRVPADLAFRSPLNASCGALVHEELGFPTVAGLSGPDPVTYSAEQIGVLSGAESLLIGVDGDSDDTLARLQANPLWGQLPAVQAGRVFTGETLLLIASSLPVQDPVLDLIERTLLS